MGGATDTLSIAGGVWTAAGQVTDSHNITYNLYTHGSIEKLLVNPAIGLTIGP
jgi:hypothetical protein